MLITSAGKAHQVGVKRGSAGEGVLECSVYNNDDDIIIIVYNVVHWVELASPPANAKEVAQWKRVFIYFTMWSKWNVTPL